MNKKPNFVLCEKENATLYSGYFIKPKNNHTFDEIMNIINSTEMENYVYNTSGNFGGEYKSYTKKVLDMFPVKK